MKKWKIWSVIVLALLTFFLIHENSNKRPYFDGPFHWSRMEVKTARTSRASAFPVYESIEKMTEIFQMEVGDECYFLRDERWQWRDTKDPAFALSPVFCPQKGGGWAMLPED